MNTPEYAIHGPMWQFECESCQYMGDCCDTEQEAIDDMKRHDCYETWKQKIPSDVLKHLVENYKPSNPKLKSSKIKLDFDQKMSYNMCCR